MVHAVPALFKGRVTMNNKRIGMQFEQEMCRILSEKGYWVHFISPDNRGAQPFDLIFAKDGLAFAADCKTSKDMYIRWNRLEDNQILAFEKWMSCGNGDPFIFVKCNNSVFCITYTDLKFFKVINLRDRSPYYVFPSRKQN